MVAVLSKIVVVTPPSMVGDDENTMEECQERERERERERVRRIN